jgi:hypothetical protein
MPRNVYFSHGVRSEQRIHEDLIIEALRIYGHDMYYIPRGIVKLDTILNEDVISKFGDAFKLECYIENIEGYGGDGALMSKFGLQLRDQMNVVLSRRRWEQLVARFKTSNSLPRPGEGDLIYFPMGNALMEIKFVENKSPFFQLQNLPTYRLTLEMFEYSGEELDTGVEEIDQFQLLKSNHVGLTLSSVVGQFSVGERITCFVDSQTTMTAEVVSHSGTELIVVNVKGSDSQFEKMIGPVTGSTSGATAIIGAYEDIAAMELFDPTSQNKSFETEGNSIIDFSEMNPFGEANYQT